MRTGNLTVEELPLASLRPYERNARTHSPGQVEQIVASVREFGWTNPLLIDEAGLIIAGHGRLLAAKALGLAAVPCIRLLGLSDAQKRALTIADNKLGLNAGWDETLLAAELQSLGDLQSLVGFSEAELLHLFGVADPAEDERANSIPMIPANPVTRPGDLWVCGEHRILCGDCRQADDIAALLAGRAVNVAFTSPPYAEQRDYDQKSGFKPVAPDEYVEWFEPLARNIAEHLAPDGSWFVNIKPNGAGLDTSLYVFDLVLAHVRRWGWHFATEFCWERGGVPKSVTRRFKNQFEPIYQFARGPWKMRPDAVRHESENVPMAGGPGSGQTSWRSHQCQKGANELREGSFGAAKKRRRGSRGALSEVQGANADVGSYIGPGLAYPGNRLPPFASSHEALGHAAAFPVGLPEFFCKAFSDPGDVVLDPFLGSGSTLIAADRTQRVGLGCEISPAYVDVAVLRWQNFTGKQATGQDGRTFADVASGRASAPKAA